MNPPPDTISQDANSGIDITCDIFIRSYRKDFEWLGYCLKSIESHCREFRQVILTVPERSRPWLAGVHLPERTSLVICRDYRDDYLGQQITKLYADLHTDAEFIFHVDSDCIFSRPAAPSDFLVDGKPSIVPRPIESLGPHYPWRASTERFLGFQTDFDFMYHPPFVYPRWIYPELRAYTRDFHGLELEDYVDAQPPRGFSEFNVLGAFAWEYHRDRFRWPAPGEETPFCHWHWSWGGMDPVIREDMQQVIKSESPSK